MSRIVYVNGTYRPYGDAAVHVEDRGFQFADSVYEVVEVLGGALVDETRHLARLERSLAELGMEPPVAWGALRHILRETIRRNRVRDGLIYIQVSRGTARRNFALPPRETPRSLIVIARSQSRAAIEAEAASGIAVVTRPDPRWDRCDIKTVMLLPAVLAKHEAKDHGAKEVWFLDEAGNVTEGGSSNAWIVTADGRLVTRALDHRILPGITRATAIDAAHGLQMPFEQRAFSREEALAAREAFISSATNTVMPVVSLDGQAIGDGRPGPLTKRLRAAFHLSAEIADTAPTKA